MQRKICTRKIDELGRIVLPLEARAALGIKDKQTLDVYIEESGILLKLNNDTSCCSLCGQSEEQLIEVDQYILCKKCIARIKKV